MENRSYQIPKTEKHDPKCECKKRCQATGVQQPPRPLRVGQHSATATAIGLATKEVSPQFFNAIRREIRAAQGACEYAFGSHTTLTPQSVTRSNHLRTRFASPSVWGGWMHSDPSQFVKVGDLFGDWK